MSILGSSSTIAKVEFAARMVSLRYPLFGLFYVILCSVQVLRSIEFDSLPHSFIDYLSPYVMYSRF